MAELEHIVVRGAKVHNLKNIDVTFPRYKLIVITGLSGSGKSSLAFDTIYAEGQRRFMETLSAYARQFVGTIERPDVDFIDGLSPVISIEQKTTSRSPRSTVGTITEIYDFMRLLYAKVGARYDPKTGQKLQKQSEEDILNAILKLPEKTKVQILSPLVTGRKGHYRELFEELQKRGFVRVRIDGETAELQKGMKLDRYKIHEIELVVDRLVINSDVKPRLQEAVSLATKLSESGASLICEVLGEKPQDIFFSKKYAYADGTGALEELAPNHFSFNSPYGACRECDGLGEVKEFSPDLMIPDPALSIKDGGLAPLGKEGKNNTWQLIKTIAKVYDFKLTDPISALPKPIVNLLIHGSKEEFEVGYSFGSHDYSYPQQFAGLVEYVRNTYENTQSASVREWAEGFMLKQLCPSCHGARLRTESLFVKIAGKNIAEIADLPVNDCLEFFKALPDELSGREQLIARPVLNEITKRLKFLLDVGLGYLTVSRSAATLSGGEAQRIRLASQLGSQLTGVLYILDEPSIGLHQRDNRKLIGSLEQLRDLGNTVIVVEHDKETMEHADYLLDLGPGAGEHGGTVVGAGHASELPKDSLTAKYLHNEAKIDIPQKRREGNGSFLTLEHCSGHNLKNVTLNIPLGKFVTITGVSGSGKSSLINETLYPILANHFYRSKMYALPHGAVHGLELIDKVVDVDQSPIGRTPRSNAATYTGVFTFIRDFFATLPESQIRGYKAGRFSFNVKGGRCEVCQGDGMKKIEMNFLPDVYVACDACKGKRYNRDTLQVHYRGKNIADVLEMTIEEAAAFFTDFPRIKRILQTMESVGLGYLRLGQSSTTLSGGEAQRVKLSTELAKVQTGKTVYILDEPTTGLHFQDIRHLLDVLHRLVDKGNTVIIIEHNLDVIKQSDWLIDLGPEGGSSGGEILAEGTPEKVAEVEKSHTGRFLRAELNLNGKC
ncbi:excinuclease ABC, A subunit [Chloroherpeton thalassium ATCC 35110]|uniref:UvrABC system protein A n=1 Tax=Chloroherpeton thalassium (strain ATCC 35110 / GB-78) TaxID=517418 RepID=B3QVM7_CHLT3|nr:excinuclease ABC subunit UvrA [Chloroherpeton thalassium]ACF13084.1 excinuclease ABC, A subunit [Chloroherpeton thalassium ATCC 35110]